MRLRYKRPLKRVVDMNPMRVNDIFYSLQGEGARKGSANIFIRLAGCSAQAACKKSGTVCDTDFKRFQQYTTEDLLTMCKSIAPQCFNVVWTGGEPLDQLTDDVVSRFNVAGYFQALETSGIKPPVLGLTYLVVSPKVPLEQVAKNFSGHVINEVRYVVKNKQPLPKILLRSQHYFLSPHSDGEKINRENLQYCIDMCLRYPIFKLSVQEHKEWKIK
jgi:7-carboxy-7-deazaguanine synthase